MRFLLDHDVPEAVANLLLDRHHEIHRVRDLMAIDSQDRMIAEWADKNRAIVVTCNVRHFKPLLGRLQREGYRRYRFAGLLGFECGQVLARGRLEAFVENIEHEGRLTDERNGRLVAYLTRPALRIER